MTGTTDQHLIPQNLDAEQAILGGMIMSPRGIDAALETGLKATDFYRPEHRLVFTAAMQLYDTTGAVDELTTINELKRTKQLKAAGGHVAVLALAERVPSVANAKAYADEVRKHSALRNLVEIGHEIARMGYEAPTDVDTMFNRAGELVAGVACSEVDGGFVAVDTILDALYDEWGERSQRGSTLVGTPTGFPDLDQKIGGLRPGTLIVVGARPAMGKTAFALNIAEFVAVERGEYVAVFSMEMSAESLASRLVSGIAKVDGKRLTNTVPQDEDWASIVDAIKRIKDTAPGRLLINDSAAQNTFKLRSACRKLHRRLKREGKTLGLVLVDYLQLMEGSGRAENRQIEVSGISRALKVLSRELGVPIMALSQLSRKLEERPDKRPMLSDLRDSGAVEQDSDVVLFLHRPEYYQPDNAEYRGKAEVIVAKNRSGDIGSVWLEFKAKYTRFVNLAARVVNR